MTALVFLWAVDDGNECREGGKVSNTPYKAPGTYGTKDVLTDVVVVIGRDSRTIFHRRLFESIGLLSKFVCIEKNCISSYRPSGFLRKPGATNFLR